MGANKCWKQGVTIGNAKASSPGMGKLRPLNVFVHTMDTFSIFCSVANITDLSQIASTRKTCSVIVQRRGSQPFSDHAPLEHSDR